VVRKNCQNVNKKKKCEREIVDCESKMDGLSTTTTNYGSHLVVSWVQIYVFFFQSS
jgi:hypothetical protein